MKFAKDDIQQAYRTTPIEESLLVFQTEKDTSRYIEYAILELRDERLNQEAINNWIDSIERFKDCYIYEQSNPLRIRMKQPWHPVESVELNLHCIER